ncbi:WXG100 family type VII secretion target [Carnobacterium gallinarum]|uniref:WXG100 family type VII secretion target n=1 Tax=Carnobacterium gallinarum TaxID=2749 RepID=UPI000558A126|nr:WXG100 family type VII secretion target [Carnobacterium gallinarum]
MVQIKLTPDELEQSATKYTEGAGNVREILQRLNQEQETISSNWEGTAFTRFEEQFIELSGKVNEFADLLDQINRQLVEVAGAVRDTDAEIASKLGFQG